MEKCDFLLICFNIWFLPRQNLKYLSTNHKCKATSLSNQKKKKKTSLAFVARFQPREISYLVKQVILSLFLHQFNLTTVYLEIEINLSFQ